MFWPFNFSKPVVKPVVATPPRIVITTVDEVNSRRKVFCNYILARYKGCSMGTDPTFIHLDELAAYLDVGLDIKTARDTIHQKYPHLLAHAVECIFTGEPWTEAAYQPVGEKTMGGR